MKKFLFMLVVFTFATGCEGKSSPVDTLEDQVEVKAETSQSVEARQEPGESGAKGDCANCPHKADCPHAGKGECTGDCSNCPHKADCPDAREGGCDHAGKGDCGCKGDCAHKEEAGCPFAKARAEAAKAAAEELPSEE